ncbi:hypothetical protein L249_6191 [Ophiocordyceps polyrhachis-furcata BCC 54312]|uniref:Uncharacterized protein n=1 Tax=Ophiocordyceps polyrhachis-furcata BCC 54312 TaxID=1330021 RepID=A0A367LIH4_9HYPO|nr:hypothetical protein L249_6191 [Ophiocordyceps polyrhachis-furcata BCC 54312]
MDPKASFPNGVPLQTTTAERMNRSDGSVHDKISQFNSLSIAFQSKQLERKTADAALKRALVGREEAEAEMRRLREETAELHRALDEGRERERKVGERLETVMENYGRAKETHAHTQALWEKEIRRARKENFKCQSAMVKLQEELKSTRWTTKSLEEAVEAERCRVQAREEEAFSTRYQLVGTQEKLDEALCRIKLVEQERDAFKLASHHEQLARVAAEGRIPLPKVASADYDEGDDEFASPVKNNRKRRRAASSSSSSSSLLPTSSSAVGETEREELLLWREWERHRADRATELVEFLEVECRLGCCSSSSSSSSSSSAAAAAAVKKTRLESRQTQTEARDVKEEQESRRKRRQPVEPPSFALQRSSLESLLEAPQQPALIRCVSPILRPHTSTTTTTTTTKIPLRDDHAKRPSSSLLPLGPRTPSSSSNPNFTTAATFDRENPALTPTMTREQALATIRERRGRVRSAAAAAAAGAATPKRIGAERRYMSAPTPTSVARSRS